MPSIGREVVTIGQGVRTAQTAAAAVPAGRLYGNDPLQAAGPNWQPLPGGQAIEEALLRMQAQGRLKDCRYLHFGVHGNLSTSDPALSGVVLSQRNLALGTDGYITAAEWPNCDLRSDLTVLSAGETGLGRQVSGEGVLGLPFALFVAGNVNTVLSLWPVDDETTAEFMKAFFGRLKDGATASQALAATKREFALHPRSNLLSFWAPFILVGAG